MIVYKNGNFGEYFKMKSYQNILQNAPNETRSLGFGLIDKSQHSRPDNIIDDVLFINIFLVTMLIHDSNSSLFLMF